MRCEALVLVVGLLAAGPAAGAGAPAHLEASVAGGPVAVGDRVTVQVRSVGASDLSWGELRVEAKPDGPWAVVGPVVAQAKSSPPTWRVELAPMAVGDLELPEMHVTVRGEDGEAHRADLSQRPQVTVATVLPPGEKVEPANLHDPVGVHGFPWEWVVPIGLLLLPLIALGWWGLRRWRRRGRPGVVDVPVLPPLPELEALLTVLAAAVGREPAESVCDRLAGGVRRYLGRISGEPAQDMTSFELRLLGRRLGWPEEVQRGVQAVMNVADGVRFGRRPVGEDELRAAVDRARLAARLLADHLAPISDEAEEAAT